MPKKRTRLDEYKIQLDCESKRKICVANKEGSLKINGRLSTKSLQFTTTILT